MINPIEYLKKLLTKKKITRQPSEPEQPDCDVIKIYIAFDLEGTGQAAMEAIMHGLYKTQTESISIAINEARSQLEKAGHVIKKIRPCSLEEYQIISKRAEDNGDTMHTTIY